MKKNNHNGGFTLILSLVLLLVMSLMGGTLIVISSGDHQSNNTSDQYSYNAPYDALVYGAGGGCGDDDANSRGAGTAGGPGVVYVEEYK